MRKFSRDSFWDRSTLVIIRCVGWIIFKVMDDFTCFEVHWMNDRKAGVNFHFDCQRELPYQHLISGYFLWNRACIFFAIFAKIMFVELQFTEYSKGVEVVALLAVWDVHDFLFFSSFLWSFLLLYRIFFAHNFSQISYILITIHFNAIILAIT